jgi:hypothetical protein
MNSCRIRDTERNAASAEVGAVYSDLARGGLIAVHAAH